MVKLREGSIVPFPEKLHENYQIYDKKIVANVGADKILDVLRDFVKMNDEPMFFILELFETIYYIDGCSQEKAFDILTKVGDVLIKDGISAFGYGCHISNDEIIFGKYNVVTMYSHNIEKYNSLFETHGILKTDNIITAWDTISGKNPGKSNRYNDNGKTVLDIPKELETWGMYEYKEEGK